MVRLKPVHDGIVRRIVPKYSSKTSTSGEPAAVPRNFNKFFRKTRTDSRRLSFQNLRVRVTKPKKDIYGLLGELQEDLSSLPSDDVTDTSISNAKNMGELAALEELPLSPLMHPLLVSARKRFQEAKPLPGLPLNEFQKLLSRNPFAQILASPVRVCTLTAAHLPASLLIPFSLQRDPRTGKLWQLPTEFTDHADKIPSTRDEDSSSDSGLSISPESEYKSNCSASPPQQPYKQTTQTNVEPDSSPSVGPAPLSLSPAPSSTPCQPTVPKAYISGQLSCLSYMSSLTESQNRRLLPFRWKNLFGEQTRSIVWRVDMADFVLSLLRKRVMHLLLKYSSNQVYSSNQFGHIVPYYDRPTGTEPVKAIAAVLWVPRRETVNEEGEKVQKGVSPPPYAFLRQDGPAIPVFDMSVLLEVEALAELRRSRVLFRHWPKTGMLGIRRQKVTMHLIGALWGLMSYMRIKKRELEEWTDVR